MTGPVQTGTQAGTDRPTFRVANDLLDDITRHSLDEDYRADPDRPPGSGPTWRRTLRVLAVLAAFGLLLATAAVQTSRGAADSERSRAALISQIEQRRAELTRARQSAQRLQGSVTRITQQRVRLLSALRRAEAEQRQLGAVSGAVAVTGPGLRVVVDDKPDATTDRQAVLDTDLQRLVNGLWVAGAGAVAINGQRVTNLTAIRQAGEAITVNFGSLRRPYVVEAIGDPDQLPARFVESAGGTWWFNLRSVYSLRFDLSSEDSVTLPAVGSLGLRVAHGQAGEQRVTSR